ncbi:MAG: hypothetical protein ACRDD1_10280, partial [Planctomycetia bacterium]
MTEVGGVLYFSADDGVNGDEVWRSDGVSTNLVSNIRPGILGSIPRYLTNFNNVLLFFAADGQSGYELYRSDGTDLGTSRLADVRVGALGSDPRFFTEFDGAMYFIADDGVRGQELWKTDGNETGTLFVEDVRSGPPGGFYEGDPFLTNVNGVLYFRADDGVIGRELWRYHPDAEADGVLLISGDSSGAQAESIPLGLFVGLFDSDGSESLTVTISGVPNGSSFSRGGFSVGTQTRPGVWSFTGPELSNLTFHPPVGLVAELFFTVVATNVDNFFTGNPRPGRSNVPRSRSAVMTVDVFDRVAL